MTSDSIEAKSKVTDTEARLIKAVAAHSRGDTDLAERLSFEILKETPDCAHAVSLLAEIRMKQNQVQEALDYSKQAIAMAPDDPAVMNNYADLLNRCDKFSDSLEMAESALLLNPDFAEAHVNRATALTGLLRFREARKALEKALGLKPELKPVVYGNLVLLHGEEGQYETARKYADIVAKENPGVYELVLNRHRLSMYTPSITRREERDRTEALWEATPLQGNLINNLLSGDVSPDRRLRVGYFSADFRNHPVSIFLEPVLKRHDKRQVQTILYDVTPQPDGYSEVIRRFADGYHCGLGQSDFELAKSIADDNIDLLIDLTGVFKNNRLNVFRYRPAPIQLMWIGYSGTSGLAEMDYIIADKYVCPADADVDFSENIFRLPDHYLCHDPVDIAVTPQNPFARPVTGITFGNFNNHMKLNSDVVRVWAEILKRVPNSTLYLKAGQFGNANLRRHVRMQFEARGIERQRLRLSGPVSAEAHMSAYNEVDIALDPFPYCGTTTTVDALSMGVPVVTLVGERWVQRTSYGFLSGMGWDSLCAFSEQEYIDIAIGLAKNPARLQSLKANGREKFHASPMCDPDRFTRDLESAYRMMWQRHCENVRTV